jgi:glucosyl-3-phosphoglycerate phosphatase
MDIYLVRHGQTDGNVAGRHQHPNITLNEQGQLQARQVATLLRRIRPTHLITSTNIRAMETAKHIARETDLIPETYPAFEELRRPAYLIGERMLAWTALKYALGWFLGLKSAAMHDGESHADFLARLATARSHIMSLPDKSRVVIVSHSVFINFFLEHMNKDKPMGFRRALIRFWHIIRTKNTAVTRVRYYKAKPGDTQLDWQILARF